MDVSKIKTYAKFCSTAYAKKVGDLTKLANSISTDWKLVAISDEIFGANDLHYRSFAMLNSGTKEILVANSGTRVNQLKQPHKKGLLQDIIADIEVVLKQTPTQFTEDGVVFLDYLLNKYSGYSYILTGHSLGAVFAQLSHTYLKGHGINAKSFVFESPGALEKVENYIEQNHFDFSPKVIAAEMAVFNTAPNVVNLLHEQIGDVYRIRDKSDEVCTIFQGIYNLFAHSFLASDETKRMLKIMEKLDIAFNTFESHGIDYIVDHLDSTPELVAHKDTSFFSQLISEL